MGSAGVSSNGGLSNGVTGSKGEVISFFFSSTFLLFYKAYQVTLTGYEVLREASGGEEKEEGKHSGDTPNVKKRHRRMKSNPKGGAEVEEETFELQIVSLDNKQWHFEAGSAEDRDEWVQAIEQQILNSLQVESLLSYVTICYTIICLRAMRVVRQEVVAETIWVTMPQYRD